MQAQLRAHKDFEEAKKDCSIVKLLGVVYQFCLSGEFGIVRDANLWVPTQHWKLLNYTQLKDRDTEPRLKDLADLYNTQVSLGGKMPFGNKLMLEIWREEVGPTTGMAHYYDSTNGASVLDWDLANILPDLLLCWLAWNWQEKRWTNSWTWDRQTHMTCLYPRWQHKLRMNWKNTIKEPTQE